MLCIGGRVLQICTLQMRCLTCRWKFWLCNKDNKWPDMLFQGEVKYSFSSVFWSSFFQFMASDLENLLGVKAINQNRTICMFCFRQEFDIVWPSESVVYHSWTPPKNQHRRNRGICEKLALKTPREHHCWPVPRFGSGSAGCAAVPQTKGAVLALDAVVCLAI